MKTKSSKLAMLLSTLFILSGISAVGAGLGIFMNDNKESIIKNNGSNDDSNIGTIPGDNPGNSNSGGNNSGSNGSNNDSNNSIPNGNEIRFNNSNLTNLRNQINSFVINSKLSYSDLENNLNETSSLNNFKSNLVSWSNNLLTLDNIGNIELSNDNNTNKLIIQNDKKYKFSCSNTSKYFDSSNSILTFNDLRFYNDEHFDSQNINQFKNKLQNYATQQGFTNEDFKSYVESNEFIKFIVTNLQNTFLDFVTDSSIGTCNFDITTNTLSINPSETYKFVLNSNPIEKISISNFNLYQERKLVKLDSLYNAIKTDINNRNFTSEDFERYVISNNSTVKNLVATNLYVSEDTKISASEIKSVTYQNNNLLVTLNPPANTKYAIDKNDNVSLTNNILTIANLSYSNVVNLTKLNVLWNEINNYIIDSTRKYTVDDFKSAISASQNTFKQMVSEKLYIGQNTTISIDKIQSVGINANNQFEITLNNSGTKYTIDAYTNAELSANKLILKNLNYYNLITVSDTNLSNLKTSIQNYITNNKVTASNVTSHIANINNLVSNVRTTDNQNLGNFVGSVTYSNNAFTIPLTGNNKMNVKALSNIQVNVSNIVMSNFTFYVEPVTPPAPTVTPSPESWFTWSGGTIITGLTSVGKVQNHIVLPAKTAALSSELFQNNQSLISIDMSLTNITEISDGAISHYIDSSFDMASYKGTIFGGCTNLEKVVLPPKIQKIGKGAFIDCKKLTSISFPSTLQIIGWHAFYNTGLTSLDLPSSVTTIYTCAFKYASFTANKNAVCYLRFNNASIWNHGLGATNTVSTYYVKNDDIKNIMVKKLGMTKCTIIVNPNI